MTKIFFEYDSNLIDLMNKLRSNYDSTYEQMSNEKMMPFKYIDTKEIPSYILTLPDEDLIQMREHISKDDMYRHLASHLLDALMDKEENEEIIRKVELLG